MIDIPTTFNKFQICKIISSKDFIHSKSDCLIDKFKEISGKIILMKKLSKSKLKFKSKPWITKGSLKSIRHKNNLYKILCKNNFSYIHQVKEHKIYSNKLTKIKKKTKNKGF